MLATGNAGKIKELQGLLQGYPLSLKTLDDVSVVMPEETGETFVENAIIKARAIAEQTGLPSLADDSGLVVDVLNGAPGVYSARFAGVGAGSEACNVKLLAEMRDVPEAQRGAFYYCALCLVRYAGDPMPFVTTGWWQGVISEAAQGDGGFGYDPLFYVPDQGVTAAQMPPVLKRQVCHRGQALQKLLSQLDAWLAVG